MSCVFHWECVIDVYAKLATCIHFPDRIKPLLISPYC